MLTSLQALGSAGGTAFRQHWSIPAILVTLALAGAALVVVAFRKGWSVRAKMMLLTIPAVFLVMAPMAYLERVVVTADAIRQTTLFGMSSSGFGYELVDHVQVKEVRSRRGSKSKVWEVHYKNGHVAAIKLSGTWVRNSDEITALLESQGVRFL